jgi:hypothetical protein
MVRLEIWKPRETKTMCTHKIALKIDPRYTVALEFCGYRKQRWVARFCGEWLGSSTTRAFAVAICEDNQAGEAKAATAVKAYITAQRALNAVCVGA